MDEYNKSIINVITTLVIIFVAIYLIFFLKGQSNQCMSNPMVYGIKIFEKDNNAQITCTCSSDNPKVASVIITSSGIKALNNSSYQIDENFSKLALSLNFTK